MPQQDLADEIMSLVQDDDYDNQFTDLNVPGSEDPEDVEGDELDIDGELDAEAPSDPKIDDLADAQPEDPRYAGLIRTVPHAHLAYKKKMGDGSFEELWVYNSPDAKTTFDVRRAILAGTDIPQGHMTTEDGSQEAEIWSRGNVEMMKISGLQS